jgi:GNAT superfamily N-acetyltransferase
VGVYRDGIQLAYGRVVTDRATFAWICDVFVDESTRGQGIGTWLVQHVVDHLHGLGVYRIMLATHDAHDMYAKAGFTPLPAPERYMQLYTP